MKKTNQIKVHLKDAINAGRDKEGNVIQIPVFESIIEIDGELYGIIEEFTDASKLLLKDNNSLLN